MIFERRILQGVKRRFFAEYDFFSSEQDFLVLIFKDEWYNGLKEEVYGGAKGSER